MSKVVSPFPPSHFGEDYQPPIGARWWRFSLRANGDGNTMIIKVDDAENPSWCSWEFFDGENTIIDTGFDRPLPAVLNIERLGFGYIDVLSVDPPTPSPHWELLPLPGYWPHPEGVAGKYVGVRPCP